MATGWCVVGGGEDPLYGKGRKVGNGKGTTII
jgi:hypothetical protein